MTKITLPDGTVIEGDDLQVFTIDGPEDATDDDDEELFLSDGADEQPPDFF